MCLKKADIHFILEAFHFGSIFYYRKEKKEGKELTFAGNKKQGKRGGERKKEKQERRTRNDT